MSTKQQGGCLKAITIFDNEGHRTQCKRPVLGPRWSVMPAVVADVADVQRIAASERMFEKFPRPHAGVAGFPHCVTFQPRDGLHALNLLPSAPLGRGVRGEG